MIGMAGEICCCGMPVVALWTLDSSWHYAQLCSFESADGCFPTVALTAPPCASASIECPTKPETDPDGSGVGTPKSSDIDRWNEDRIALNTYRSAHEDRWPIAIGELGGKFRNWAGVIGALMPSGEANAKDTYGDVEIRFTGTSPTARVTLADLQDLFDDLFAKHNLGGKTGTATLLLGVDNSGSITLSQWPAAVKASFLAYIASDYPNVTIREYTLTIALSSGDTERWLKQIKDQYQILIQAAEGP